MPRTWPFTIRDSSYRSNDRADSFRGDYETIFPHLLICYEEIVKHNSLVEDRKFDVSFLPFFLFFE